MMFLEGNIAAPPTITVFSSARAGATMVEVSASALKATADNRAIRFDMESLPMIELALRTSAKRMKVNNGAVRLSWIACVAVDRNYGRLRAAVSENNSL